MEIERSVPRRGKADTLTPTLPMRMVRGTTTADRVPELELDVEVELVLECYDMDQLKRE